VLKLDVNGSRGPEIKYLKVYKHDDPEDIVENFAIENNLSEKAKNNLLNNVLDQLNEESGQDGQTTK
jgi:hypothetical protein